MPPPIPWGTPYQTAYRDAPHAVTALVLGILGLVVCQFCAPFAWYYGNKSLQEIAASGGTMGGQGNARAGQVLGIIGTVIMILIIVFYGALILASV